MCSKSLLTPSDHYDSIRDAFRATHDGRSVDDVIIDDDLNDKFIQECRNKDLSDSVRDLNWCLVNARKQGKIGPVAAKRVNYNHDDYLHASEIAARLVCDKHGLSVDRVLCDPVLRHEFDLIAIPIVPDVSEYLLRKAALKLRKTRKLKPELVVRVASWGKDILTLTGDEIIQSPELIPKKPGIYIFRDNTGYLYIGESGQLRQRVVKHLDHSDRKSLAHYLWQNGATSITVEMHAFDPKSEGRMTRNRRAYESDLIQSRQPKFNIQP